MKAALLAWSIHRTSPDFDSSSLVCLPARSEVGHFTVMTHPVPTLAQQFEQA